MKRIAWLLLAAAALRVEPAFASEWRADPAASRLEFIASFERAPAPGRFKAFDAHVKLDPDRATDGRVDVTIDVTSADMGNGDVNRAIRGPEWFDAPRHPEARFRSAEIRPVSPGRFVAAGRLALKGVERAVDVPFAWQESGEHATMEGELRIARAVFAIGTGEWADTRVVGPDVVVRFSVRLHRAD
jgi:polyisoprenoid-binding protein YceI